MNRLHCLFTYLILFNLIFFSSFCPYYVKVYVFFLSFCKINSFLSSHEQFFIIYVIIYSTLFFSSCFYDGLREEKISCVCLSCHKIVIKFKILLFLFIVLCDYILNQEIFSVTSSKLLLLLNVCMK